MITLPEYLQYQHEWREAKPGEIADHVGLYNDHINEIRGYNKALVEKYPFLLPRNRWSDEVVEDYDYSYTELDAMPDGWRLNFGDEMVEEISQELKKFNFENQYRILQIKEKWGGLRWYDGGAPRNSKIFEIIDRYEKLSYKICIICGDLAVYETTGWISPFCADCVHKVHDGYRELTVEDYLR